jgi:hypothetical protein
MMHITAAQVLTELSHHIGKDNGIHVGPLVMRITGKQVRHEPIERRAISWPPAQKNSMKPVSSFTTVP